MKIWLLLVVCSTISGNLLKNCQQTDTYDPIVTINDIESCIADTWQKNAEENLSLSFKLLTFLHKIAEDLYQTENKFIKQAQKSSKNQQTENLNQFWLNETKSRFHTCQKTESTSDCCQKFQYFSKCCNQNDQNSINDANIFPECQEYQPYFKKFNWYQKSKLNYRYGNSPLFCQSFGQTYDGKGQRSSGHNFSPLPNQFFHENIGFPELWTKSCDDMFYQFVLSKIQKNLAWASIADIYGRYALSPWLEKIHCSNKISDPRLRPWWIETIFNGKWIKTFHNKTEKLIYKPRRITFILSDQVNTYSRNINGKHSYQDVFRNVTLSIMNRLRWNIKVGIFFDDEPLIDASHSNKEISSDLPTWHHPLSSLYLDEIKGHI